MAKKGMYLPVIFRVWKENGDVIAIFPTLPGDGGYDSMMMYERMGQHGSGNYRGVVERTTPASKAEYASLFAELKRIYEPESCLVVKKRLTREDTELRRLAEKL